MMLYTRAYSRNKEIIHDSRQLLPAGIFVFAVSWLRGFPPFSTQYLTFSLGPAGLDGVLATLPRYGLAQLAWSDYTADSPNVPGMYDLRALYPQASRLEKVALAVPPWAVLYEREHGRDLSRYKAHVQLLPPADAVAGENAVVVNPDDIGNAGFLTG
jgi:hypothetical protein